MRRKFVTTVVAAAVGGVVTVLGAATAGAVELAQFEGGMRLGLNHDDAVVVSNLELAPVLAQVPIGWSPAGKRALGESIGGAAARVAESPQGDMWIDVYGPLGAPDSVAVTTRTAGR
ncbi:hypothetical protein ACIBCD_23640 [Nocardia brasiliensis]|uniref:hypothetical protein n=1 Tax=Nocardia brasiliensis TaxID=37326 RepID=UPI0037B28791